MLRQALHGLGMWPAMVVWSLAVVHGVFGGGGGGQTCSAQPLHYNTRMCNKQHARAACVQHY